MPKPRTGPAATKLSDVAVDAEEVEAAPKLLSKLPPAVKKTKMACLVQFCKSNNDDGGDNAQDREEYIARYIAMQAGKRARRW